MSKPGWKHWEDVKNIFQYLRGTEDVQLMFGSDSPIKVEGFIDSEYTGNPDNWMSTSGYVFTYGGHAISWRSKLQDCTTLSITEAEYIAASEATKEAIWLHQLLADFSAKDPNDHLVPTLYCNSESAIHIITNLVYHPKTTHIEVRYHHIRELVTNKKLEVQKVDTEVNITNSLTKTLLDQRFNALTGHMGLQQATEQRRAKRKVEGTSKNGMTRQVEGTNQPEG